MTPITPPIPLTPRQAIQNLHLLLEIVRGTCTPRKRVAALELQLTGMIAQGIQGDDIDSSISKQTIT